MIEMDRLLEKTAWYKVAGVLVKGYGVASGISSESPYPFGSLVMQKPYFNERGLDLEGFFLGTLNIDISPYVFEIFNPLFKFEGVEWYEGTTAETFSFADCFIEYENTCIKGYVYYPHPETKLRHFQSKSLLEIIAPYIENVRHGVKLSLYFNKEQIRLTKNHKEARYGDRP